jgi:hypothetical protein
MNVLRDPITFRKIRIITLWKWMGLQFIANLWKYMTYLSISSYVRTWRVRVVKINSTLGQESLAWGMWLVYMRSGYQLLNLINRSEAVSVQRLWPIRPYVLNLYVRTWLKNFSWKTQSRDAQKPEYLQHVSTNSKFNTYNNSELSTFWTASGTYKVLVIYIQHNLCKIKPTFTYRVTRRKWRIIKKAIPVTGSGIP